MYSYQIGFIDLQYAPVRFIIPLCCKVSGTDHYKLSSLQWRCMTVRGLRRESGTRAINSTCQIVTHSPDCLKGPMSQVVKGRNIQVGDRITLTCTVQAASESTVRLSTSKLMLILKVLNSQASCRYLSLYLHSGGGSYGPKVSLLAIVFLG